MYSNKMYLNNVNRSFQFSIYQVDYHSKRDSRISIFRKFRIYRGGKNKKGLHWNRKDHTGFNFGVSTGFIDQSLRNRNNRSRLREFSGHPVHEYYRVRYHARVLAQSR